MSILRNTTCRIRTGGSKGRGISQISRRLARRPGIARPSFIIEGVKGEHPVMNFRVLNILLMVLLILISRTVLVNAEEQKSGAEENASNPLAAVNNTDIRWKYFDLDGPERNDFYLDGSYMLHPKLKLKYDLHYWDTDVTGSSESDWESLHLKPIYYWIRV
jgi:hypothetical protein